jgi:hypothetical protein
LWNCGFLIAGRRWCLGARFGAALLPWWVIWVLEVTAWVFYGWVADLEDRWWFGEGIMVMAVGETRWRDGRM